MGWSSGLQIRVLEGRDRGRVIPLDAPEMTLGRALDANESAPGWVLFGEPTVSRVHAVLHWNEGRNSFMLHHRSRTNPTLVDGKPVEQVVLQPGQRVQLGLLVFCVEAVEVRSGKLGDAVQQPVPKRAGLAGPVLEALNTLAEENAREGMLGPSTGLAETAARRPKFQRPSPGSMRLLAAQGPDQGTSFPLREPVLVIGRLLGMGDSRTGAGVLLNDDSLPGEQALLVWQDREYTYGILQAEGSPVPTRIRLVVSGRPKDVPVSTDLATLLYEGDVIMMGRTSLVVRRAEPTVVPDLEEPEEEEEPAAEPPPPPRPSSDGRGLLAPTAGPRKERIPPGSDPNRPLLRSWRDEAPSDESLRMKRAAPPRNLDSIVENPDEGQAQVGGIVPRGLPPHLEASLRPGRTATPAPPPRPAAEEDEDEESGETAPAPAATPDVPMFDPDAIGNVTSAWKYKSDFVIGYVEGSRKGQKIALLGSELHDDRVVTVGSPGTRINDIEVDEAEVANDQAVLRYRSGRFTLVNTRGEIQVNSLALGEGDQVVLMTGDRIQLGRTVLIFLERRVVEILRNYRLEVVVGVEADLGRVYELGKERLMIGRGRSVDIRLADMEVSRVHCVLVHRNGRFYVQHRSDTNPTFVNGISLLPGAERLVNPGDKIQVSSHSVLLFRARD